MNGLSSPEQRQQNPDMTFRYIRDMGNPWIFVEGSLLIGSMVMVYLPT